MQNQTISPTTFTKEATTETHKLCMIPGPVEFHEDVLTAMSTRSTSHVSPTFIPIFGECIELLRRVLFTLKGQPFVVSGSGSLGWDMVASNIVEPNEDVLVLNTGYFGDSFASCFETYGARVTQIKAPIGDRPSLESITETLKTKQFKVLTITHVDTSTGVLSDIKAIAELVMRVSPNTLVVVDGVCSVGVEEIRMDEWSIDVVMTASQKALGVPPGLTIVVASERAINTFEQRKTPITSYYASWRHWLPIMKAYESRRGAYFATPAVQLIYALNTSLKQITTVPLETRFEQHKTVSNAVKDAINGLGLRMLPKSREMAANGMTAIYYPDRVSGPDLLQKLSSNNIVVAGGLHKAINTKYFRIGHMGISVTEPDRKHLDETLQALRLSLRELGYSSNL